MANEENEFNHFTSFLFVAFLVMLERNIEKKTVTKSMLDASVVNDWDLGGKGGNYYT